jgi:tetratricopeptide (TPR) repeat protein
MFDDPLVRIMLWATFGIVILYLAAVLGALAMGVLNTSVPKTASERALAFTESAVQGGDHSSKALADYVNALIDVRQFGKAQGIIDNAPKSARLTAAADLEVSQARLYYARKDYTASVKAADEAMKVIQKQYEAELKKPGTNAAKAYGLDANYYDASLIKGLAQQAAGDYKAAIASYTVYLEKNPMESNVLVSRAEAKLKLNDTAGAKADYQAALKFVPDHAEALAGLKKIGAQK